MESSGCGCFVEGLGMGVFLLVRGLRTEPIGYMYVHKCVCVCVCVCAEGWLTSPGWCGSADWASSCKWKGHWFDSQSGFMPGLQYRAQVGGVQGATDDVSLAR